MNRCEGPNVLDWECQWSWRRFSKRQHLGSRRRLEEIVEEVVLQVVEEILEEAAIGMAEDLVEESAQSEAAEKAAAKEVAQLKVIDVVRRAAGSLAEEDLQ